MYKNECVLGWEALVLVCIIKLSHNHYLFEINALRNHSRVAIDKVAFLENVIAEGDFPHDYFSFR